MTQKPIIVQEVVKIEGSTNIRLTNRLTSKTCDIDPANFCGFPQFVLDVLQSIIELNGSDVDWCEHKLRSHVAEAIENVKRELFKHTQQNKH